MKNLLKTIVPTPFVMYGVMEEIKRRWPDTYVSAEFNDSHYPLGRLYVSPRYDYDVGKEIKGFLEEKFSLKLKPDLNKETQVVDYKFRNGLVDILLRQVYTCTLVSEESFVEERTEVVEEVKEVITEEEEREITEEVTMRTYRCPGGVEYTVESREEI